MKTGLEKLDNIIHSLNCGELTCIASRPGLGKTTLLIDIVNNVSKNTDNKIIFEKELVDIVLESERSNVCVCIDTKGNKPEYKAKAKAKAMLDGFATL